VKNLRPVAQTLAQGLRLRTMALFALAALISGFIAWSWGLNQLSDEQKSSWHIRAMYAARALQNSSEIKTALEYGKTIWSTHSKTNKILEDLLRQDNNLDYLLLANENNEAIAWATAKDSKVFLDTDKEREELISISLQDQKQKHCLLRFVVPIEISDLNKSKSAQLFAGFSVYSVHNQTKVTLLTILVIALGLVLIFLWFFWGRLFGRVRRLQDYAINLASGNLTQRLAEKAPDEIGRLARALESITENMAETISRMQVASLELDSMSDQVRQAASQIAQDASEQAQASRRTSKQVNNLSRSGENVATQINSATGLAEQSSNCLNNIFEALENIGLSINELAQATKQAQDYVQHDVALIGDVDGVVQRLNEVVEDTAAATTQIATSIKVGNENADRALQVSKAASDQAQSGVIAVKDTREGIDQIREFNNRAVKSIYFLSEKVASIENILEVIVDIANQTRLLALNASIIASQAGEHGRGFSVVAGEIKALAAKTAGSTREIGSVINEVLSVSGRVIDEVEKGVLTVTEAIDRSENADQVLAEILKATTQASNFVRMIANSMNEQTRGSQRVDQAVQDIHATAIKLRDTVSSQTKVSNELNLSNQQMLELTSQSRTTAKQQLEEINEVRAVMEEIFAEIRQIVIINQAQIESRQQVAKDFSVLAQLSQNHKQSAARLSSAVQQAASQSSTCLILVSSSNGS